MQKKHLVMILVIGGLALAGCDATDKPTANESSILDFASWSQEIEKQRISHPDHISNVGDLGMVSYVYSKLL